MSVSNDQLTQDFNEIPQPTDTNLQRIVEVLRWLPSFGVFTNQVANHLNTQDFYGRYRALLLIHAVLVSSMKRLKEWEVGLRSQLKVMKSRIAEIDKLKKKEADLKKKIEENLNTDFSDVGMVNEDGFLVDGFHGGNDEVENVIIENEGAGGMV